MKAIQVARKYVESQKGSTVFTTCIIHAICGYKGAPTKSFKNAVKIAKQVAEEYGITE